ncbi:8-oxo-dGTP diphosphatase [Litoreibacter meonggei]|uniref:8-oxo-dGTP diphosphatase n=1 Tax=Litoreibacter meonggei TaxID=1049199 RepID=A0A497WKT0_9RHOB|nr:NUDIX hydrolase [Litoreibacter meonggei]RLJ51796.1 8-oxo-dGTP diphosphatase [Litoreibacter meonggei]
MEFHGAKVAVFIGERVLVALRDDFDHIPFPACWDFAGGGRELGESPEECVLRELKEEFGLTLMSDQLVGKRAYQTTVPAGTSYFFAAHLPAGAELGVVFGDEGQRWALMSPDEYLSRGDAIAHLQDCLRVYLERL